MFPLQVSPSQVTGIGTSICWFPAVAACECRVGVCEHTDPWSTEIPSAIRALQLKAFSRSRPDGTLDRFDLLPAVKRKMI